MAICASCSATLPADARFCLSCGRATDPGAAPTMTSPPVSRIGGGSGSGDDSDTSGFDHGRFAPGTRLGDRYRIVGRLGVGGMGEVYRADDLKLGQSVALKFLPAAVESDPARLERLTAEIRTARQISHPNACRVYDIGEVDSHTSGSGQGRRFLTMEYVDGEDLKGLLRRIGRLPEDKGLEIARQICAGLAAIHDRDVLHRDLKPANIMIDGRGRVRLTDFGLATTAAAAAASGEIAGTPAYMAPEQLTGQQISVATDLYALGLILFEIFTGERAIKSDRIDDARDGRRATASTLTTSGSGAKLDPMIRRVIERCVDPDPARRPQSAIVVAAALPGGDPLAAALAAGETPSPQMVAAAGAEGGLSFKVAIPLLLFLIAGTLTLAWLTGRRSYPALVPFPNSPEILAGKAREMLGRLGYTDSIAGWASGFAGDSGDYAAWLRERDKSASRWQHVASVRPPIAKFWYRSSPRPMEPYNFFGGAPGGGIAVTLGDPPLTVAGMTAVQLDPSGRLVSLDVEVTDKIDPTAPAAGPDWAALFREADLDIKSFAPATPEWVSRTASDATAAWTGPGADATGEQLRVEAAAFRGRPVFFRLIAPWTRPVDRPIAATSGAGQLISQIAGLTIIAGTLIAAIGLSLRNLRLGRTDTRGATRVAAGIGGVTFVAALLGTSIPSGESPAFLLILTSWAAFGALVSWTLYAALEPYVRRQWPQMLISWSRVLDGRWRDPLVGRDLLVGSVLAVAFGFGGYLRSEAIVWRGAPRSLSTPVTTTWEGLGPTIATFLGGAPEAVWFALGVVMLLVVLRLVLRSAVAAMLGFVVLFLLPGLVNSSDLVVTLVFNGGQVLSFVLIATRLGLVTLAIFLFINPNVQLPLGGGFHAPAFAQTAVWFLLAASVALGVFGFFTSTRGRKASGWLDG